MMTNKTTLQPQKDDHESLVSAFVDFLQSATPAPSFLGGEKARLSYEVFDRALRDAIVQARPIYHPADADNSRFTQYDAEILNSTFQSWKGHIQSSPAYSEGQLNSLRCLGDEDLLAKFRTGKKPAQLTAEVLRRLESDKTFIGHMFELGNGAFALYDGGFRKWFNPVLAESPDDCIKIISKISNSPKFAYAAPDFYPALGKGSLTGASLDRECSALMSTFKHLDNADKIFKGKPFAPVGQMLGRLKSLGALPNLSDLPHTLCQYTDKYKEFLAPQVKALTASYEMESNSVVGAMMANHLEPAFHAGVSVSVLAGIIGATSFMSKDFSLQRFERQTLSEQLLSNVGTEPKLLQLILKKGRSEGLFSDQELFNAKVDDELWKYSVIGQFMNPLDRGPADDPELSAKGHDRGPASFDPD
jgi:hypothetical protein